MGRFDSSRLSLEVEASEGASMLYTEDGPAGTEQFFPSDVRCGRGNPSTRVFKAGGVRSDYSRISRQWD